MPEPFFDFAALDPATRYKLLTATVIPRPIAWITTLDPQGVVNAAPFSFFNVFGQDPALVVLGLEHLDGAPKDTTRNIAATGEFVINIATQSVTPQMVATAKRYAPGISEPDALNLDLTPSHRVAPPRLTAAAVALECRKSVGLSFSQERELLVGEVLGLIGRPGLIDPTTHRVDWQDDFPVARLFGPRYARLVEIESLSIPT